jgi:hypothetical protein
MWLIKKIIGRISQRSSLADEPLDAGRLSLSELEVLASFARLRRSEVETDVIVANIRDQDERRRFERRDQWILVALIALAGISLLTSNQEQPPYLSPAFLTAGFLFRLVWATRRRGPPDGD